MNNDDLDDFLEWKERLKINVSSNYLEKEGYSLRDYELWKAGSALNNYDERILMKAYMLEKRIDLLERILMGKD